MKRLFSVLLAALLAASVLVSCSESNVNSEEKTTDTQQTSTDGTVVEEEEETARFIDSLPETMDFEGAEIRFIAEEGGNGNLTELSIFVEEDTGDVVESAVYNRNLTVSDRLNVNIVLSQIGSSGIVSSNVKPAVTAGSDDYDVVGVYQYYGISLATQGIVHNLNSGALQYNDFSREYWGRGYMENLTYKNMMPWCTGDLALRYTGGIYATYINKDLWNNFYNDINIYDLVDEGEWTLDKMYDVTSTVYIDANGDGKKDLNDTYGYNQSMEDPLDGIAAASMVRFSQFDEEGNPYITLNSERTITFYEKLYRLCCENEGFYKSTSDDNKEAMTMFAEGRSLMHVNKIYQSGVFLRDMEEDFALIPTPKLNDEQEHYNTMIHDSVTLFGVPITVSKLDATSATLEALASESYRFVSPAYFDVALKVKYTRDSDAGRMIDIIRENVSADFAGLYSGSISDIIHFFRSQIGNGSSSISSAMEKSEKVWNKSLSKLCEKLESVAESQG